MEKQSYSLSKNQRRLGYFILIIALVLLGYLSGRQIEQTNQPNFGFRIALPNSTETMFKVVNEGCTNSLSSGFIVYREGGNLRIQDTDGCSSKLIFGKAISPPTWSPDGKNIAVECNTGGEICILDARLLFDQCLLSNHDKNTECQLPVLAKYTICSRNSKCQVAKISWSPKMDSLAISYVYEDATGNAHPDSGSTICILSLTSGSCKTIYSDKYYAHLWADWSPVDEHKLVVSDMRNHGSLFLLNSNGKNKQILTAGIYPTWSPDGKKIIFYKTVDKIDRPLFGIALANADGSNLQWIFVPPTNDAHNPNLGVGCSNDRPMGGMSWSPDLKYIVLAVNYDSVYVCRLARLGIEDGNITLLTPKSLMEPPNYYYDPIWKP